MTIDDVMLHLKKTLADTLAMKGSAPPVISESTRLLGGDLAIDSLDLAGIVVGMTETTGKDPFAAGFIEFRTVGELARLFAD